METQMDTKLRRIGAGFCGTVWAALETGSAYKREDGGPERSLLNDYKMHQRIQDCMRLLTQQRAPLRLTDLEPHSQVQVPLCYGFIQPENEDWWEHNLHRFPDGYAPCNMIHAQRIPPFKEPTRARLVDRYCPSLIKQNILNSDTNKDCLIRPYLGRRRVRPARPSGFKAFSLRNYPLHRDQMEEMEIPIANMVGYARAMADALAALHWICEVDGNDIEFVLAPPENEEIHANAAFFDSCIGLHNIWMLDFDLVRPLSMDIPGVQQAVTAFLRNDPFYPRPEPNSVVWKAFRDQYLQTSRISVLPLESVIDLEKPLLAEMFIHALES